MVLAVLALSGSAQAATLRPVVKGNRLVDAVSGQTFVPRGANWPSFEYACSRGGGRGYGYSNEGAGAGTASAMAAWHINAVRIPLNQDCWLGDDGLPANPGGTAAGYRAAVKGFTDALESAGIVPILDLHWTGPDGVEASGQLAMPDDRSDNFWTSVAETYKGDPSVMFDAFNEPYSRVEDGFNFTLTWACWKLGGMSCGTGAPTQNDTEKPFDGGLFAVTGMAALVQAIRSAGATQPIMLGGLDYSNDLTEWLANRPSDPQLVASFHNYPAQACRTVACWDGVIASVAGTVPVVTGEFGEQDCRDTFVTSYMTWADAHDVGYLAWAWWDPDPQIDACHELALLNADGSPRFPNGTALKDHLGKRAAEPPPPPQRPPQRPPSTTSSSPVAAVTALHLSPPAFRAARSGASVRPAAVRMGTRVRYTLNVAATVRFTVQRASMGRRVGARCVRPSRANSKRRSCSRFASVPGSFSRRRSAGVDRFTFTGRVGGHRLRPGRYRLLATPTANAHAGKTTRESFRIIK
jgi:endoglucanase